MTNKEIIAEFKKEFWNNEMIDDATLDCTKHYIEKWLLDMLEAKDKEKLELIESVPDGLVKMEPEEGIEMIFSTTDGLGKEIQDLKAHRKKLIKQFSF
jgi:hypothetical protein